MPDNFDIAQICLNGHLITHNAIEHANTKKAFCEKCGEKTICDCQNCHESITGGGIYYEWVNESEEEFLKHFPLFCRHCGKPYPWTERKLAAIKELATEIKLPAKEKELLVGSLNDLIVENPKTAIAVIRWKKVFSGVGSDLLAILERLLTDVLSETIRKMLFG